MWLICTSNLKWVKKLDQEKNMNRKDTQEITTEQKDKPKGKIFFSWNKNLGSEISSMTGRLLGIKFHEK